jgi:hypothetical protein
MKRIEYTPTSPILIEGVPAYLWYRGCGPTAAGMVLGYWDGQGYVDLFPGSAATRTSEVEARLASQAHYNDYALPIDYYPNLYPDKSEPPVGDEHSDNSLADFMDTSQSYWDNRYGWSWLSDLDNSLEAYVAHFTPKYSAATTTLRWSTGLPWSSYKAEIDAGRPVVFLVDTNANNATDHFVAGMGYAEEGNKKWYGVYDTWDFAVHWYEFKGMASGVTYGIYAMTTFTIQGEIPTPLGISGNDTGVEDRFGIAVAIEGDLAVVGAYGNQPYGAAYVFQRIPGNGYWEQIKKLTPADGGVGDYFGVSVAISGNTVLVGALWHDPAGVKDAGAAYVFERNTGGTNNWGQVAKLTLGASAATGDELGIAVALEGSIAVVGAHRRDVSATDTGAAAVFYRDRGGANKWGLVTLITASDPGENDYLGYALSLSGDTLLVGAYGANLPGATDAGAAYLFRQHSGGADHWGQVKKLTAVDAAVGDAFGLALALDFGTAVVGAYLDDHSGYSDAGSAYVFAINQGGMANWGQTQKITAGKPSQNHWFGDAFALQGNILLIGTHRDDSLAADAGAVHLYTHTTQWAWERTYTAGDGVAGDWFGFAVALSQGTFLVGAPHDDNQGNNAGAVYFLSLNHVATQDTVGTYEPDTGRFKLRNSNTPGTPDIKFSFGGSPGYLPLSGDWDGDGVDSIGVYDPVTGKFRLRNSNNYGLPDLTFTFGGNGSVNLPVAGDWNGDGIDTIGVYVIATGKFKLNDQNDNSAPEYSYNFGGGNLTPLAGDWDGDGVDSIGTYDPLTGTFKLRNSHSYGLPDVKFRFGPANQGWLGCAGDWDGDGDDNPGLFLQSNAKWRIRYENSFGPYDLLFKFGVDNIGMLPVPGDWDGS